ncbi:MAG: spermidine synthase [Kofleriaceae bacterium]
MIPWEELGRAKLPDGELVLSRRGDEYVLRMRGAELMNSRSHASEELLATLGCANVSSDARVLIGGLGMGFTARAALGVVSIDARIVIAELVPDVVAWNRGPLAHLAAHPLDDPRVSVRIADVAEVMAESTYHAILLDVDNGPDAFTAPNNAKLYGVRGLERARRSLVPGGVLGVWSVAENKGFTGRLRAVGFTIETHRVPPRPNSGARHVVWIARAPR